MNIKITTALKQADVDIEAALSRFAGNSKLYEKFLLKFLQDENFSKIKLSLDNKEWENAFNAAHTLKGVSGNLGMTSLFSACSKTVTFLREQDYYKAVKSYAELKRAYEEIINILEKG